MQDYSSTTWTCVDHYTGTKLMLDGTSIQYAVYRQGVGEQLYVVANWYPGSVAPGELSNMLYCVLNDTVYSFTSLSGWADPVCVLPGTSAEAMGSVTAVYALVAGGRSNLSYGGSVLQQYRFAPGTYDTLPQMSVTTPTLYGSYTHTIRWTLTAGDGRNGWVTALSMRVRETDTTGEKETALFSDSLHVYYNLQTDSTIVGKEVCLVLEYRTFDAEWNGYDMDAYVTRNRYVTAWQTVARDASIPLAPDGVTTSLLLAGGKVTVRWETVVDPLNTISSYKLERSVNGGNYTSLYSGTSTQFRDTLPTDAQTVAYRVCAVNSKSAASPWTDSGTLAVAQSNLYVAKDGKWVRAAGVWIGDKRASPMARVK